MIFIITMLLLIASRKYSIITITDGELLIIALISEAISAIYGILAIIAKSINIIKVFLEQTKQ